MSEGSVTKGVLLLAFGGADSIESVGPFVKNILKGRDVAPEFIEEMEERYEAIGGKSPLLDITRAQAKATEERLNAQNDGETYKVFFGMLNWGPYIKEAIAEIQAEGLTSVKVIVLAPFAIPATMDNYKKAVAIAIEESGKPLAVEYIEGWHVHPLFVDLIVEGLKEQLKIFDEPKNAHLLFTAHSLPLAALRGDAYQRLIRETVFAVTDFVNYEFRVAYQSMGRTGEWLGPEIEEIVIEASAYAKEGMIIIPLGFVSDNVETLFDIDIVVKKRVTSVGMKFGRTPAFNTNPKFIEMLAHIVCNKRQNAPQPV
jgi:ferrochelatase